MAAFEEEIAYEINWRTNELSILKSIPYLFPLSEIQKNILLKYTIPAIYSIWEGFVTTVFSIYVRELNKLKLSYREVDINLLTHGIDMKYQLNNPRNSFDKKVKLITELTTYIESELNFTPSIPTESNVSFEVINNILCRFNLSKLNEKHYEKKLNKLVFIRNKIAHGEISISINQDIIDELSQVVIDLMYEIYCIITDGFKRKTYLKMLSNY